MPHLPIILSAHLSLKEQVLHHWLGCYAGIAVASPVTIIHSENKQ